MIDVCRSWDFFQVHVPDHLPALVSMSVVKGQFEEAVDVSHDINAIGAGFVIGGVARWEILEQGRFPSVGRMGKW